MDLPTLTGEKATIEQGLRALLDVPREHLLVEMEYTDRWHRLSALAWAMAEAGGRAELTDAAQAAYRELVQPFWPRIRACLHAEQAARRRTLAREGPGALLRSLAAASQHASVLRGAGLIVTRRQGGAVLHVLTPLGAELLQAG